MSTEDHAGVEATARAIVERWWDRARHTAMVSQHLGDLAAAIAAALRAAPTHENCRLEGTAIGQPTSVVTHESEGRGMNKLAAAERVVEAARVVLSEADTFLTTEADGVGGARREALNDALDTLEAALTAISWTHETPPDVGLAP